MGSSPGRAFARAFTTRRLPLGLAGFIAATVVAAVFLFILPGEVDTADGWREPVLRWGHSLVWVLLALASGGFAFGHDRFAAGCAYGAGAGYALFVLAIL